MSRITEALRRAQSPASDSPIEMEPVAPAVTRTALHPEMPAAANDESDDTDSLGPVEASGESPVEDFLRDAFTAAPCDYPLQCADAPTRASEPSITKEVQHALRNKKLILGGDLAPGVVEQYRKAAASLHQLQLDRGVKVVMVASAMAEDGKTLTASNIALTLSESFRRRVLLVDADLRRPSVHAMFGTPNVIGLNDALTAEREEKLTVFEITPYLSVLPSGRPNSDPMSSLVSERMRVILAEASAKFDWVVIDTPPVGVLADARLLAEMVHAVVLVIGAGRTPFKAIERAIDALDRKRIAGVVLNRAAEHPNAYHYYDYYASPRRGEQKC